MKTIHTDCLVIGAGLAGSAYALHAAAAGLRVDLLSSGPPLQANSDWAQGGIIYDTTPDPVELARDILAASDGTANPAAIEQLVREGPGAVKELLLDELHVGFDRDATGALDLAREGGHSERRIIHAKDTTGHAILDAVAARVDATPRITRHSGCLAIDLLTLSHNSTSPADRYQPLTCFGCYALDAASGEIIAFVARKTILATGGLGGIFLHSTNQPGSVGHGVAMAYRVGARLIDLEYVQFHPTVFFQRVAPPFLITEALRGEGAVLVDGRGRQFMQGVHPLGSLSPIWSLVAQGLILGPTLSALAGLGEEAGWRGLLHTELSGLGFWRESWIVGLLWGAWHLPLVFEGYGFPNHPLAGAGLLLAFTLLAAPLYTFIRIRAESTLACAVFHGSFAASMLLTFAPIAGGSELTVGLLAVPGVLVMILANAALACLPAHYRRPNTARAHSESVEFQKLEV